MRSIVHICLADAVVGEPQIKLPGGLALMVFESLEPGEPGTEASGHTPAPGVRYGRELPQPGISLVAESQGELIEIIRREMAEPVLN